MLHSWSGRCKGLCLTAVALVLLAAGSAQAGLVEVPIPPSGLSSNFSTGNANEMDLTVVSRVYQIVADGSATKTTSYGNTYAISDAYAGQYLYEYTVHVDANATPKNSADPFVFQVDWGGVSPNLVGQVGATAPNNPPTSFGSSWSWVYYGQYQAATGATGLPVNPGSHLTWYRSGGVPSDLTQPGQYLGTLWAVVGGPPKVGAGQMTDDTTQPSAGSVLVPTPELPSLCLLLSSGGPLLGIGYLRRRRKC